jgi:hypothetical protein
MALCRFDHRAAQKILGQQMPPDFFLDRFGSLAPQHVHVSRLLDAAQV